MTGTSVGAAGASTSLASFPFFSGTDQNESAAHPCALGDINNDGKKDGTDKYLMKRRKAIGKAIAKKRGKVKEGFSAWRIDLDFNEQVKK